MTSARFARLPEDTIKRPKADAIALLAPSAAAKWNNVIENCARNQQAVLGLQRISGAPINLRPVKVPVWPNTHTQTGYRHGRTSSSS